ncbi:MAG: site-2 protease family protein [Phycisphaerales bacterium]|jgi:regulator of sigma E protease|nr:site-2 protease family protein [Phycisphaerales bacterium]
MSIASSWNVILIVLGFGMLIGLHELGHFLAAKWSGIRTNAFAIGMGPVLFAWRGGIGFTLGSSKKKTIEKFGKDASEMSDAELQANGLSETEYSLRFLPIGGFVSMLGQEDGKPDATSEDPRSYNKCSIEKRMVVVSAGVIMNLLLAAVLFVGCFQYGVRFEAPVIGEIAPHSPASEAIAADGSYLQTGDTVVAIDGKRAYTFTDLQIAGAMAKPGTAVQLDVERSGSEEVLHYSITPRSVTQEGLLELGLYPASSLTIPQGKTGKEVLSFLSAAYPELQHVQPGSQLVEIQQTPVSTWAELETSVQESQGKPLETIWAHGGATQSFSIIPVPSFERYLPVRRDGEVQKLAHGLYGLSPLPLIKSVVAGGGNEDVLQAGDVVLGVDTLEYPRQGQLRALLETSDATEVSMRVLRNEKIVNVRPRLTSGKLGVLLTDAWDVPILAQPIYSAMIDGEVQETTIAGKQIIAGSTIQALDLTPIANWYEFRTAAIEHDSTQTLTLQSPLGTKELYTTTLNPTAMERETLAALGWTTPLIPSLFEPLYVTRSSGGNPLLAIKMGIDETVNMVVMTYLTIDRLLRRSVGVEQLRGPVGIIHIGSRIADRGFSYLLFFLAIISVNLAVLNFLPLPIVDGGLFLYLLYEKFRGRPPSIAFQNAAAMLGLGLIGMLFVVTFYNDIVRLIG